MGLTALVALDTQDVVWFHARTNDLWNEGIAVLPIDHRSTPNERSALIEAMRPTRFESPKGSTSLAGGIPVDEGIGLVVPTSGTTGPPKGVMLSGTAIDASAKASNDRLNITSEDTWIACLPLGHIAGLSVLQRARSSGANLVLHLTFDPHAVANAGTSLCISLVPALFVRLMESPARPADFKVVLLGGGPIDAGLVESARDRGWNVITTYGMTETCGGCVYDGLPLDGVEIRTGRDSRIEISGPVLMDGYRLDPTATEDCFDGRWFSTTDAGAIDSSGRLEVFGRLDTVIVTGGEKVWPDEVEEAIATHPDVDEVAVFGAPDTTWGNVVVAAIVTRGAKAPSIEDLKQFLSGSLAPYKVPRRLIVVDELPRTALGKIDRAALASQAVL